MRAYMSVFLEKFAPKFSFFVSVIGFSHKLYFQKEIINKY